MNHGSFISQETGKFVFPTSLDMSPYEEKVKYLPHTTARSCVILQQVYNTRDNVILYNMSARALLPFQR